MTESALFTGPLAPTNGPYAVSRFADIKLCQTDNRQYGVVHIIDYRSVMPTNRYGLAHYHPSENSQTGFSPANWAQAAIK